jgi:hypothetical protein
VIENVHANTIAVNTGLSFKIVVNHTCVVPTLLKRKRLWGGVTGKSVVHALSIAMN